MPDPTPPVERRWGADGPAAPGRRRRRTLLAVLLSVVAVAGVAVGLLAWLSVPRPPAVLPVWVTTEPGSASPVPWAEQDRAALTAGDPLGRPLADPAPNPTRDQLRLHFRALDRVPRAQPVVVHLAAPAGVDAAGAVYLLPADPLGDHPRNRLPLAELLALLRECPARDKLLVLDLTAPPDHARLAPPPGDLATAVQQALADTADPHRLCLVACGPGQVPLASPDLGRSVFAYHLDAGLRGAADGWGPAGDRDGRVTATELAAFVRARVTRWSAATLRPVQTPLLVGDARDFAVHAYPLSDPPVPASPLAESATAFAFPDWLRAAWERHDRWPADGRASSAPRAFALLRGALLAAERDLLAGRAAADVRAALDRDLARLDALAAALTAAPAPTPLPTLAATYPGYVPPDRALLDALTDATRGDIGPVAAATKPGDPPAPPPALPATFEPFVKKPHAELALAAFRVLADDPAPAAGRVRRVAQLLAAQEPSPKFAETLLLHRLAALANPVTGTAWSADRAALALQTARAVEEVAARPEAIAWARPALDEAYQRRADAEAVLFAPAYASVAEADRRLRTAGDAARTVKASADQLRAALAARDEAVAWLVGATPAVAAGAISFADATRLADATAALADVLMEPAAPVDAAAFAALAITWRDREAAVRTTLEAVAAPVRSAALARLRARTEAGDAGPALLAELDTILLTPLVAAGEREALWNARATLTRRLAEDAVRKDAADDDAIRKRLASPDALDPRDPVPAPPANVDESSRRAAWAAALLRVGGLPADAAALEAELTRLAADAPAVAARLRRAWVEDVPARLAAAAPDAAARLAAIAPAVPATAFLDRPERNPTAITLRERSRRMWAWHAARFEYDARDADGADFAFPRLAARACAAVAGPHAAAYLDIAPPPLAALTPEKEAAEFAVDLRALGTTAPLAAAVRVLSPDDEWVRATGGGNLTLDPVRAQAVRVAVAAGPRPAAHPALKGVLVEAEAGGRTFHRRVPVSLDAIVNRLDLLVRADPTDAPRAAREISLRPHGIAQPFQFLLANPTPRPRTVVARLVGFDRTTAPVVVEPGKVVLLKFAPPPAPPAPPVPAPPPTPGKPPAGPEFDPLAGPLAIDLLDPADPEKVVQKFVVPVRVLDPGQYLKADEVTFRPAGTRPNRLSVRVVPDAPPAGPPVAVMVQLPPERNPDVIQVRDANLSGPLPADNRPLTLYAEDISFSNPAGGRLVVTVAADGVGRAFTFAGEAVAGGGTVRLARVTRPLVRVKAAPFADPGDPLQLAVALEVDHAPPGATVELRLGTEAAGEFATDVALVVDPAKDRGAGVRFDPKGESVFLRGTWADPSPRLTVGLLVGARVLEARLLDADGEVLAADRTTVVFDATPPTDVHFLDLPPRAGKGQPLAVRATCDPTISGIKDVRFFVGKPVKNEPPETPAPTPGRLIDPKGNVWAGVLQPGTAERVTVGVQFRTRAGLSKTETAEVELVDPAELAKPKPGKIAGKLSEAGIAQGDFPVFLYDDKRNPLAKATTKRDGTFEFPALPPGRYSLYAIHVDTNRDVLTDVTVNAGETTTSDLEMFLRAAAP